MKLNCTDQLLDNLLKEIEKLNKYLEIYERWIDSKNLDGGICRFIRDNEFEEIAIYGVGRFGRNLCNELECNNIKLAYLIDKNKNVSYRDYPVYTLQDELPKADVIIVTPVILFDEIADMLEEKMDCPILSLEDIIL